MGMTLLDWLIQILIIFTGIDIYHPPEGPDVYDFAADSPNGTLSHVSKMKDKLYSDPDENSGHKVARWHHDMKVNPEELGNYFEADIRLPKEHLMYRNGLRSLSARWPEGSIPFEFDKDISYKDMVIIVKAMMDFHKYTCIKFKRYTGEESDYIRITADHTGCWSSVGRIGGRQDVNLQVPGCVTKKGTIIHELMHTVGFLHEQSRFERDEYVTVRWANIVKEDWHNFVKASRKETNDFGVTYDYSSVMHYSAHAFSKNRKPTLIPRVQGGIIGQRDGFSWKDIIKIRRMYNCK